MHNIVKEAHGKLIEISKSKKQYQGLLADLTVQVHEVLAMRIRPQQGLQHLCLTSESAAHQDFAVTPLLHHGVQVDLGQATRLHTGDTPVCQSSNIYTDPGRY